MTSIKVIKKDDMQQAAVNNELQENYNEPNNIDVTTLRDKVETINGYVDRIDSIIDPIYKRETAKLTEISNRVKEIKDQARNSGRKIDDSELEILLLDLALEIGDVMERIEERALDVDIANAFLEENSNKALLFANDAKNSMSLSNANLQKAYASNLVSIDKYTYMVKNRIYKKLQSKVDSAEKLFYGIKSILGRRL